MGLLLLLGFQPAYDLEVELNPVAGPVLVGLGLVHPCDDGPTYVGQNVKCCAAAGSPRSGSEPVPRLGKGEGAMFDSLSGGSSASTTTAGEVCAHVTEMMEWLAKVRQRICAMKPGRELTVTSAELQTLLSMNIPTRIEEDFFEPGSCGGTR